MSFATMSFASHFAWWLNELRMRHNKAEDLPWLLKDISVEIQDAKQRRELFDLVWTWWQKQPRPPR
jgi:hypothetical protein